MIDTGSDLLCAVSVMYCFLAVAAAIAAAWLIAMGLKGIWETLSACIKYWIWGAKNKLPKDDWRFKKW